LLRDKNFFSSHNFSLFYSLLSLPGGETEQHNANRTKQINEKFKFVTREEAKWNMNGMLGESIKEPVEMNVRSRGGLKLMVGGNGGDF
jgi:hypothetical protein